MKNLSNDEILVNCRLSFGCLSVKFVDNNVEWSLKISVSDSDRCGVEKYSRDDSVKWGAFIDFKEPIEFTGKRFQRCFSAYNKFDKETARIIWEHLIELGFKPTKDTEKILTTRNR